MSEDERTPSCESMGAQGWTTTKVHSKGVRTQGEERGSTSRRTRGVVRLCVGYTKLDTQKGARAHPAAEEVDLVTQGERREPFELVVAEKLEAAERRLRWPGGGQRRTRPSDDRVREEARRAHQLDGGGVGGQLGRADARRRVRRGGERRGGRGRGLGGGLGGVRGVVRGVVRGCAVRARGRCVDWLDDWRAVGHAEHEHEHILEAGGLAQKHRRATLMGQDAHGARGPNRANALLKKGCEAHARRLVERRCAGEKPTRRRLSKRPSTASRRRIQKWAQSPSSNRTGGGRDQPRAAVSALRSQHTQPYNERAQALASLKPLDDHEHTIVEGKRGEENRTGAATSACLQVLCLPVSESLSSTPPPRRAQV
eukprot:6186157-Pleurochrysis_carterae.AAC.6